MLTIFLATSTLCFLFMSVIWSKDTFLNIFIKMILLLHFVVAFACLLNQLGYIIKT